MGKLVRFVVSFLWVAVSCGILWFYFGLVPLSAVPLESGLAKAAKSYLNFSVLLVGGGFSYHILTKLLSTPYTVAREYLWWRVGFWLACLAVIMTFYPVALAALQDGEGWAWYFKWGFYAYIILAFGLGTWLSAMISTDLGRMCDRSGRS